MRYGIVLALAASCTCLTPVDEQDGGAGTAGGGTAGGGTAGGGTAGGGTPPDAGCTRETDCSGTRPAIPFCGPAGGAGWSCVDRACLWECNGGRSCTPRFTPDGGCLTCGAMTACRGTFCPASAPRAADIEHSTCMLPFDALSISTDGGCRFVATPADGGAAAGTFEQLSGGDFLGTFPGLGGTCTGTGLPTGVERWVFNCPTCQFIVRF